MSTCVCPPVSLQLVAPGEPLAAEDPVADEGPLAGVPAQVGPQVGRLAVHLAAAFHVTDVLLLLRRVPTGRHAVITGGSSQTWRKTFELFSLMISIFLFFLPSSPSLGERLLLTAERQAAEISHSLEFASCNPVLAICARLTRPSTARGVSVWRSF